MRLIPFTQELADDICERLINGESLRAICLNKDMPSASLVCRWLGEHDSFREQYARAREAQADTITDEILHIADNTELGVERTIKPDGSIEEREGDMIAHRRLKIDARKWYASKLAPKKYGDKVDVQHEGSLTIHVVDYAASK